MIMMTCRPLEMKCETSNYSSKAVALLQNCRLHSDLYQHNLSQDRDPNKMTSKGNKHIVGAYMKHQFM